MNYRNWMTSNWAIIALLLVFIGLPAALVLIGYATGSIDIRPLLERPLRDATVGDAVILLIFYIILRK